MEDPAVETLLVVVALAVLLAAVLLGFRGGAARQPAARSYNPGPVLRDNVSADAWIEYADADGVLTTRRITIRRMHGDREPRTGRALVRVVYAYCHLRQDYRHFVFGGIQSLREREDGPAAVSMAEIGMALRSLGGLRHAIDDDWAEWQRQKAEREAQAEMWRLAREARDFAIAGDDCLVLPTRARITTFRADRRNSEATEDIFVLGYHTDGAGQPSVLFVGKSTTVKRGRMVFLGPSGNATDSVWPRCAPHPTPSRWAM